MGKKGLILRGECSDMVTLKTRTNFLKRSSLGEGRYRDSSVKCVKIRVQTPASE